MIKVKIKNVKKGGKWWKTDFLDKIINHKKRDIFFIKNW